MKDISDQDVNIRFMTMLTLGIATMEEGNDRYMGLVINDFEEQVFVPMHRNPTEEDERGFAEDFKAFDMKWTNLEGGIIHE